MRMRISVSFFIIFEITNRDLKLIFSCEFYAVNFPNLVILNECS